MSYSSLSELVQAFENPTGNPSLYNQSGGTASGLYQFVPSTWRSYLSQIGGDTSQYPTAASAPASVQNSVFQQAVSQNGLGDWTCPGCNPALSNYVNANSAGVAALPTFSGGTSAGIGAGNTGSAGGQGTDLGAVAVGGSTAPTASGTPGLTPNPNSGPAAWITALTNWLGSLVARGALVTLAVILIAGGVLVYALRTREEG